jgi:hypothetical protein
MAGATGNPIGLIITGAVKVEGQLRRAAARCAHCRGSLLPALALALLAGLRGAAHVRRALCVLPAAWLLGGVLGLAHTAA